MSQRTFILEYGSCGVCDDQRSGCYVSDLIDPMESRAGKPAFLCRWCIATMNEQLDKQASEKGLDE